MSSKNKLVLTSIATFVFIAFFSVFGSAAIIFEESFESGNLSSWTISNKTGAKPWNISQDFPKTGLWHVEAKPNSSNEPATTLSKSISTAKYKNIKLSYARQLGGGNGFEAGDEFKVLWSVDGNNFFVLEDSPENLINDVNYVTNTFNLPALANNNPNFQIKFECSADAQDKFCRVDDIKLEGDQFTYSMSITPKSQTLQQGIDANITITNTGNMELPNIIISEITNFGASFSKSGFKLAEGAKETITVVLTSLSNLKFGNNIVTIQAKDSINESAVDTATIIVQKTFCKAGEKGGNLTINKVKIENTGKGKDKEWRLLDTIEVEVEIKNRGREDIEDVIVQLGFLDSSGADQVSDFDFDSKDEESVSIGDLDDGDKEKITYRFKVPADFKEGNYKLVVKAYSDDVGEQKECVSIAEDLSDNLFESISVRAESKKEKFIAFDNIKLIPSEATCGDSVTLTADVYNIGKKEQDQVKVTLFNKDLGINQEFEIRKDLDLGDKETVTFEFKIPAKATNKIYKLDLSAEYDYRSGTYRESLGEPEKVALKLFGCAEKIEEDNGNIASISAELLSPPVAGKELMIKVTVKNLQNKKATFAINVKNHETWADLAEISNRVFELGENKEKEITIKLNVKNDVKGEKTFSIVTSTEEGIEQEQEIVVNVEAVSPDGITNLFALLGDNAFIFVIGAINIILIIIIIIVALKIARK